jgi:AcrR family transcriptional regulator
MFKHIDMETLSRREREIQELRSSIIDQSWKIIIEEGWQALSIRKIADAIEYSVPVIYKHFENKEAILEHFSREGFEILSEHISQALDNLDDPVQKLSAIARAYWEFAAQHTPHYRIMFGLGIPHCEAIQSSTEMKETSGYMLQAISEILENVKNKKIDRHHMLKAFWSTLHGFIAIELLSNNVISAEVPELVRDIVDVFIFTLTQNK